jgi:hypothetical protein
VVVVVVVAAAAVAKLKEFKYVLKFRMCLQHVNSLESDK